MSEIERAAIEKAIKGFEHEIRCIKASESRSWKTETRQRKVERETLAVSLLRADLDREKNEPLTMDEIKDLYEASFSGFPVWCRYIDEYSYPFGAVIDRYDGEIVAVHAAGLKDEELNREEDYGKTWLAYRYEPKGEPNV